MPFADKTTLNNLSPNLAPQQIAASGLRLAAFQYLYSLSDQNYAEMQALVSGGALQLYPLGVMRQSIINPGFKINQRVVSGTVTLAAGAYGHDRWKAGSGGCTYTFATSNNVTTITITAGSLVQVIEGLNLYSGTYTLSWTGTAQGKIGAGSYGATGITATVTGGTNLSIEFNAGTLSNVQFNLGSSAVSFQPRSFAEELVLCQRYYHKSFPYSTAPATGAGLIGAGFYRISAAGVNFSGLFVRFPVTMRVTPTLTYYNPTSANNKWYNATIAADSGTPSASAISDKSAFIENVQVSGEALGNGIVVHYAADSEL